MRKKKGQRTASTPHTCENPAAADMKEREPRASCSHLNGLTFLIHCIVETHGSCGKHKAPTAESFLIPLGRESLFNEPGASHLTGPVDVVVYWPGDYTALEKMGQGDTEGDGVREDLIRP